MSRIKKMETDVKNDVKKGTDTVLDELAKAPTTMQKGLENVVATVKVGLDNVTNLGEEVSEEIMDQIPALDDGIKEVEKSIESVSNPSGSTLKEPNRERIPQGE
jgi:hypothetical protein